MFYTVSILFLLDSDFISLKIKNINNDIIIDINKILCAFLRFIIYKDIYEKFYMIYG